MLVLPMPFVDDIPLLLTLFALLLFILSSIVPILTSVILFSVEEESHRILASSISLLFILLLGQVPSTTIYGLFALTVNPHVGLTVTLYSTLFCACFLLIALVISIKAENHVKEPTI